MERAYNRTGGGEVRRGEVGLLNEGGREGGGEESEEEELTGWKAIKKEQVTTRARPEFTKEAGGP